MRVSGFESIMTIIRNIKPLKSCARVHPPYFSEKKSTAFRQTWAHTKIAEGNRKFYKGGYSLDILKKKSLWGRLGRVFYVGCQQPPAATSSHQQPPAATSSHQMASLSHAMLPYRSQALSSNVEKAAFHATEVMQHASSYKYCRQLSRRGGEGVNWGFW